MAAHRRREPAPAELALIPRELAGELAEDDAPPLVLLAECRFGHLFPAGAPPLICPTCTQAGAA